MFTSKKSRRCLKSILSLVLVLVMAMSVSMPAEAAKKKTTKKVVVPAGWECVFDAQYYASANPDLAAAFGTDESKLFDHFQKYGMKEGRQASAEFNVQVYKNTYADLQAAFGDDLSAYCAHYVSSGKSEGRNGGGGTGAATPAAAPAAAPSAAPAAAAGPAASAAVAVGGPGARLIDRSTIQFSAHFNSLPASDDNTLYVYELAVYEKSVPAGRQPIASIAMSKDPAVNIPYTETRLYEKFAFATKKGGAINIVGTPQFITNPEILADKNTSRGTSLKGLQGPTHQYQFNNYPVKGSSNNGIPINYLAKTVCLLNNSGNAAVTHPLARAGYGGDPHPVDQRFNIFMFNAADQAGVNALADEMSWLAANGSADVFIVGNEVNVRKWNYIQWQNGVSWDYFVEQYADGFRVIYNAIKSRNAGAEVLICIDQCWDRNRAADKYNYIDAKDFCDLFNAKISAAGNIDWGVSFHPHPVPLTNAKFWATGSYERNQLNTNKMISFENLGVATSYLSQPQFLKRDGTRRYMIIGEQGLVNTQGADVQAAAIAASYMAAKRNGMSQILYVCDNHGVGLDYSMNGQAASMYQALGTDQEASYLEWAKSYIGISDWGQILR